MNKRIVIWYMTIGVKLTLKTEPLRYYGVRVRGVIRSSFNSVKRWPRRKVKSGLFKCLGNENKGRGNVLDGLGNSTFLKNKL